MSDNDLRRHEEPSGEEQAERDMIERANREAISLLNTRLAAPIKPAVVAHEQSELPQPPLEGNPDPTPAATPESPGT